MQEKKKINNGINLIPLNKRTKSEQREIAKKGGIESGKIRREKKQMKEIVNDLFSKPVTNQKIIDKLKTLGYKDDEITNQIAITSSAFFKALKGDIKAMEFLRDTAGQKPKDEIAIVEVPKILDDIPDNKINGDINDIKTE
jgi:putative uncharacterized protein gbs1119